MSMEGVSHLTFIVRDPERTARLFSEGLGAQEVYDSLAHNYSLSREKFLLLGDIWLVFMEGEPPAQRTYQHVAFKVAPDCLQDYRARLEAAGAEILPGRARVDGEGDSLYFRDFDNHLFELHSGTLAQRLALSPPDIGRPDTLRCVEPTLTVETAAD